MNDRPYLDSNLIQKKNVGINPSTISSKSLNQSRYVPDSSKYYIDNSSRIRKSRWENELKSKDNNYDYNMFSNYINTTFRLPSKNNQETVTQSKPYFVSKQTTYESPYNAEASRFQYQNEKPVTSTPFGNRNPTMVESKYMRSSSANNRNPQHIGQSKINTNYLLTNQYKLPQGFSQPTSSTYRVIKEPQISEFAPKTYKRSIPAQRENNYTSSTGGLSHQVTAKVLKAKTQYTGGNRKDLVQSMYRERPTNLLEMKYGNATGTGMRY